MTTKVVRPIVRRSIRHQARRWLVRMDGDESLSAREEQALKEWMRSSQQHHRELERLAAFWREANILTELLTHNSTWPFEGLRDEFSNDWHSPPD